MVKENEADQLMFDEIQIRLASPDKIRKWSHGEVTKAETINYRTLKPEEDGLFCEKIFGPTRDWECKCGKKIREKGTVCQQCGVEITKATVRRERMGHIDLQTPVSHIWYFKGIPSRMALALNISVKELENILYFAKYIVVEPGNTNLGEKQVLTENDYRKAMATFGRESGLKAGMGAQAIKELLHKMTVGDGVEEDESTWNGLEKEATMLREALETAKDQERSKLLKRLEVIEAFIKSGNKPEWMVLDVVPVLPPDLRPMVQLDGGRFATSDLNDLYRRIINRNNRLKEFDVKNTPDIIVRNEKRMLQEAVDALIDNGRRGRPVTGAGGRALKSLSDMLKGKQGRFRQNLLGKRVDYSGRSVIVVGPELKIYQCGLPKEMALELFKPFVMKELKARGLAENVKAAKRQVDRADDNVWDVLEDVIREHPVMLNRAPTLHRLGIQAFEPILVEGKAIKLHPLVCTAFNADFDGDQMAVHLPLSEEAQAECRFMLLSPNNLLKPSDGGPVAVPSQDMVLGIYYLTQERKTEDGEGEIRGEGNAYMSMDEAILAYENHCLDLHARIKVRRTGMWKGQEIQQTVETTLGRLIFNQIIPQNLGFVDRTKKANALLPEIDKLVKKGDLKRILEKVINTCGATKTAEVLDDIKALGYKYSTKAAMTVSIADMKIPEEKPQLIEDAQKNVERINRQFMRGRVTDEERYKEVISTWNKVDDDLSGMVYGALGKYNNIFMMADSGARGSKSQIKQLTGWRGLFSTTTGHTIELPITSNFREGLNVLEYFMSAHGSRKGMSDTALRTADSGYLTRRLVDVAQDIIIREDDCARGGKIPFMDVSAFKEGGEVIESLKERLVGRFAAEEVVDENGVVLVNVNEMITPRKADAIVAVLDARCEVEKETNPDAVPHMKIRNNLSCKSKLGVCAKCYGANMATGAPVQVGEAVGIIAAQSIGEPGTQLTMRTFHTGGVAGGDITQGLPRVEELFEARNPKGVAIVSDIAGEVELIIDDKTGKKTMQVVNTETGEKWSTLVPFGTTLAKYHGKELATGDTVEACGRITEGSINPHRILEIKGRNNMEAGIRAVQDYMLHEVQKPYRLQGVEINDKHIEIIVRQMMKKVTVTDAGDTDLLVGSQMEILDFNEMNENLEAEGKAKAVGEPILLGITKASLATDSFLSAASFQETTRVLTEAAINGKVDKLVGLKENVLIGNLIPAGTGMKQYRDLKLDCDEQAEAEITEAREKTQYEAAMEDAYKRRAERAAKEEEAEVEEAPAEAEAEVQETTEE